MAEDKDKVTELPLKEVDVKEQEMQESVRMTKEEMIAKGLLPPRKKPTTALSEAISKVSNVEQSNIKEIPVQQMQNAPAQQAQTNNAALIKKAENRGSMAIELLKAILSGSENHNIEEVDDLVKFVFAIADAIQNEVDKGYQQDLIEEATKRLRTS